MKGQKYIVLKDRFERMYFVRAQNLIDLHKNPDQMIDCFVLLSRTTPPFPDHGMDERVYTFPEDGEMIDFIVHRWKGSRVRNAHCNLGGRATVLDVYQYRRSASGSAAVLFETPSAA